MIKPKGPHISPSIVSAFTHIINTSLIHLSQIAQLWRPRSGPHRDVHLAHKQWSDSAWAPRSCLPALSHKQAIAIPRVRQEWSKYPLTVPVLHVLFLIVGVLFSANLKMKSNPGVERCGQWISYKITGLVLWCSEIGAFFWDSSTDSTSIKLPACWPTWYIKQTFSWDFSSPASGLFRFYYTVDYSLYNIYVTMHITRQYNMIKLKTEHKNKNLQ